MPCVWALSDLHLAQSTPSKSMEAFGPQWKDYQNAMHQAWNELVSDKDLVLVAGDISWALKLSAMEKDWEWIDSLPGTKVLIRGNHDYWWGSLGKMQEALPKRVHVIHNSAFQWENISIGGSRLWDTPLLKFHGIFQKEFQSKPLTKEDEKIYAREIERLELSLKALSPDASHRIAMTHYPPIGLNGEQTPASELFKKYRVDTVVFGHLHNLKEGLNLYNKKYEGIHYYLTACDAINFRPLKILDI